jgi:hypothetical protein
MLAQWNEIIASDQHVIQYNNNSVAYILVFRSRSVPSHSAASAPALVPRVPTLLAHNQAVGRGSQKR